jgi:hypothetical protein
MEFAPDKSIGSRRTGLAIIVAVTLTFVFYIFYYLLFRGVVSLYAAYDPSFGAGLGALVLLVFGTSVLSCISGAVTSAKLFPHASREGMFYGIATLLTVGSAFGVLNTVAEYEANALVIGIQVAVWAATLYCVRFVLLGESAV